MEVTPVSNSVLITGFLKDAMPAFLEHLLLYWSIGGLFALLDYYFEKTGQLEKYKTQGKAIVRQGGLDWGKYRWTAVCAFLNQLFITYPTIAFFYYLNTFIEPYQNPSWAFLTLQYLGCMVVEDIVFFHIHYLFHFPFFYQHLHKIHHTWPAPVAIRSLYAHPIEHCVANIIPISLAPLIMHMDMFHTRVWGILSVINTLIVHSGYGITTAHDKHHQLFNVNYGTMGIMDYLYGTDA